MMRFMWVCKHYRPRMAGSEIYAEAVAKLLVAQGHSVCVVTSTPSAEVDHGRIFDEQGVRVIRRVGNPTEPVLRRLVGEFEPDILITNYEWANQVIGFGTKQGLPVVVVVHSASSWHQSVAPVNRSKVALWCFNSLDTFNQAAANVHHCTLYPPIEPSRVAVSTNRATGERKQGIGIINPIKDKGSDIFYGLAERMPRRMFYALQGGYGFQDRRMSMPNVVWFERGDPRRLFSEIDILLMPSITESFGMAAVEAQLNGIAVVASDLPSMRESLGDGALFAESGYLEGFHDAVLDLDDERTHRMIAARGRTNARELVVLAPKQVAHFVDMCVALSPRRIIHAWPVNRPDVSE